MKATVSLHLHLPIPWWASEKSWKVHLYSLWHKMDWAVDTTSPVITSLGAPPPPSTSSIEQRARCFPCNYSQQGRQYDSIVPSWIHTLSFPPKSLHAPIRSYHAFKTPTGSSNVRMLSNKEEMGLPGQQTCPWFPSAGDQSVCLCRIKEKKKNEKEWAISTNGLRSDDGSSHSSSSGV